MGKMDYATEVNANANTLQIMETYQLSTSTLRSVLSHPTLDHERITSTTDDLAEVLADQHEIDDAIRSGGAIATSAAGVDVDEDELADELQDLIKEEEQAKQAVAAASAKQAEVESLQRAAAAKDQETNRAASSTDAEKEVERRAALIGLSVKSDPSDATPSKDETPHQTRIPVGEESKVEAQIEVEAQAEAEWQRRYEDAQLRQREEKRRAEDERMRREAVRLPAE